MIKSERVIRSQKGALCFVSIHIIFHMAKRKRDEAVNTTLSTFFRFSYSSFFTTRSCFTIEYFTLTLNESSHRDVCFSRYNYNFSIHLSSQAHVSRLISFHTQSLKQHAIVVLLSTPHNYADAMQIKKISSLSLWWGGKFTFPSKQNYIIVRRDMKVSCSLHFTPPSLLSLSHFSTKSNVIAEIIALI